MGINNPLKCDNVHSCLSSSSTRKFLRANRRGNIHLYPDK
jgi:hypothetical protein